MRHESTLVVAHKTRRVYSLIAVFAIVFTSFVLALRSQVAQSASADKNSTTYSYPALGFRISFPKPWSVRDKAGDVLGDHWIEGRPTEGYGPSMLDTDSNKQPTSEEARLKATVAFLKGIRVTVLVRDLRQQPIGMSLLMSVNNRVQGMKMMAKLSGDEALIEPLQQIQFAGVPALLMRTIERYKHPSKPSVLTEYYDFENGNLFYSISIAAPTDVFDKYSAEFAAIVRSFSFSRTTSAPDSRPRAP